MFIIVRCFVLFIQEHGNSVHSQRRFSDSSLVFVRLCQPMKLSFITHIWTLFAHAIIFKGRETVTRFKSAAEKESFVQKICLKTLIWSDPVTRVNLLEKVKKTVLIVQIHILQAIHSEKQTWVIGPFVFISHLSLGFSPGVYFRTTRTFMRGSETFSTREPAP